MKVNTSFRRAFAAQKNMQPIPFGWAAISWRLVPNKALRRQYHGRLYRIHSDHAGILRIIRFSTNLEGSPGSTNSEIVLDYYGWLELSDFSETTPESLSLELTPAGRLEYLRFLLKHPDPSVRLPSLIAGVSILLGLTSIAIALFK